MPTLDRAGHERMGWPIAGAEVPETGPVLLELEAFRAAVAQEAGGRAAPTGVVLDGAAPHAVLDEVAGRAAAIAIRFPLFRDGRGFTLVRRLRERLGFAGPVIVMGHVLPDQWRQLCRLGASAVALPDGADPRPWRDAARPPARLYQPAPIAGTTASGLFP